MSMCACVRMHWAHRKAPWNQRYHFRSSSSRLTPLLHRQKQTMVFRIKRIVSLLSLVFLSCHIHDGLSQGANLAPSPESSNCDKFKYEEWLKMQERGWGHKSTSFGQIRNIMP